MTAYPAWQLLLALKFALMEAYNGTIKRETTPIQGQPISIQRGQRVTFTDGQIADD